MNLVHSVEKLVHHRRKIRWLSLDDDASLLLSTAEDGIVVWDLELRTHQVISNSANLQYPASWTPLRGDLFTKGFVCEIRGEEFQVFRRRHSENTFHEVLDLDEEAKDRIFNYIRYCDRQRRRYGCVGHEPLPDIHVNRVGSCVFVRAAPELGVIEIHRRGIQQPSQNDGKGDIEPPCQDEAFETDERSPGYNYARSFLFFFSYVLDEAIDSLFLLLCYCFSFSFYSFFRVLVFFIVARLVGIETR